jgi:hypothetical protein
VINVRVVSFGRLRYDSRMGGIRVEVAGMVAARFCEKVVRLFIVDIV